MTLPPAARAMDDSESPIAAPLEAPPPEALAISPDVPVIPCDARNRESTKATLVTLVEHAMSMQTAGRY